MREGEREREREKEQWAESTKVDKASRTHSDEQGRNGGESIQVGSILGTFVCLWKKNHQPCD